jgi:hypothetical protein
MSIYRSDSMHRHTLISEEVLRVPRPAIADPPLKLVLIENSAQPPGTLNHLGVEVASTGEVAAAQARLAAEDLATALEEQTTCCFAVQDKVWVHGPDGEPWEYYTVLADAASMGASGPSTEPDGSACCGSRPDVASAGTASACC